LTTGELPGVDFTGLHIFIIGISSDVLSRFVEDLLYICVLWGLVNLLPVYPLDGGQISREIFLRFSPHEGIHHSLMLSIITGGALAAFALMNLLRGMQAAREMGEPVGSPFQSVSLYVALFFGYLAFSSYATLQAYNGSRPRW
jgi:stage IV sporulation protein FB